VAVVAEKVSVRGTFYAAAVRGLMGGVGAAERTANATERTAKNTDKLVRNQRRGGSTFT